MGQRAQRRSRPPGPRQVLGVVELVAMHRDLLGWIEHLRQRYGDVSAFRVAGTRLALVNDPALARDILVTDDRHFTKGRALKLARAFFGDGLLTSEGDVHRLQRRMIQPAFYRPRLQEYAEAMTDVASRWSSRWTAGQRVDMVEEMGRVALSVVSRTLFGTAQPGPEMDELIEALATTNKLFRRTMLPFARLIGRLPLPANKRFIAARSRIDDFIYRLIEQHREKPEGRSDLMARLIEARDAEGDGGGMSDRQVRDEVLTLFSAGHETTALAMSWTWYLLSQHPRVETRLHEELERVLEGRPATFEDLPRLAYTRRVLTESMRLYPPAYVIGRMAEIDYPIRDWVVRKGTTILMSQYLLHRDTRWYERPLEFDPDRWTPEFLEQLPQCAYMPFGGGSRVCIGEGFAWAEATIVLATLAQRWTPRMVDGHEVTPEPLITLRPRGGLPMILHENDACSSRRGSTPDFATAPST